jgi:hypothetical protein
MPKLVTQVSDVSPVFQTILIVDGFDFLYGFTPFLSGFIANVFLNLLYSLIGLSKYFDHLHAAILMAAFAHEDAFLNQAVHRDESRRW